METFRNKQHKNFEMYVEYCDPLLSNGSFAPPIEKRTAMKNLITWHLKEGAVEVVGEESSQERPSNFQEGETSQAETSERKER
jgi:hypothetical protein